MSRLNVRQTMWMRSREAFTAARRFAQSVVGPPRLGLEIGSRAVRAVLVIRGRVVRTHTVTLADSDNTYDALCRVFGSIGYTSWFGAKVFAAVGPSHSQVRRLVNLPPVRSPRVLHQVVNAGAARFFLKNGVPLLISSVGQMVDHEGWAAALDEPPLRAMADACRSHHLQLELAAPTIVALKRVSVGGRLVCEDDAGRIEAEVTSDGAILQVHRGVALSTAVAASLPRFDSALGVLGEDNAQYVCAYAVTLLDRAEPLAIHAAALDQLANVRVPVWRLLLAVTSLIFALLLLLTLPVMRANRAAARAAQRLAVINRQYRAARWTENELQRTTRGLQEIEGFQHDRRSVIESLCQLTSALPPETWLQSLRLDEKGGTLVALSPHAGSVPSELAKLRSITSLVIVGAVSPEQVGQDRIERITMRFRWNRSTSVQRVTSGRAGASQRC